MLLPHNLGRRAVYIVLSWTAFGALTVMASAGAKPLSSQEDVSRLPAAAAQLYRDTTLFPRPMKYRQIPWLLDLPEGIRLAKQEKRPVLIWTSGDDPLERC